MRSSAVLLIICPDRKGLVAAVSHLLFQHGANITHADQHQDREVGLFFMRSNGFWTTSTFPGFSQNSSRSPRNSG